jgi:hypothetical protein
LIDERHGEQFIDADPFTARDPANGRDQTGVEIQHAPDGSVFFREGDWRPVRRDVTRRPAAVVTDPGGEVGLQGVTTFPVTKARAIGQMTALAVTAGITSVSFARDSGELLKSTELIDLHLTGGESGNRLPAP